MELRAIVVQDNHDGQTRIKVPQLPHRPSLHTQYLSFWETDCFSATDEQIAKVDKRVNCKWKRQIATQKLRN